MNARALSANISNQVMRFAKLGRLKPPVRPVRRSGFHIFPCAILPLSFISVAVGVSGFVPVGAGEDCQVGRVRIHP